MQNSFQKNERLALERSPGGNPQKRCKTGASWEGSSATFQRVMRLRRTRCHAGWQCDRIWPAAAQRTRLGRDFPLVHFDVELVLVPVTRDGEPERRGIEILVLG